MSKTNSDRDVSVLSSAKNGLIYLTPNDWALIADKGVRMQFKPGEFIVRKDKRTHGVYLLLKGAATVRLSQGTSPALGPGEIWGEFSFFNESPATAGGGPKEGA